MKRLMVALLCSLVWNECFAQARPETGRSMSQDRGRVDAENHRAVLLLIDKSGSMRDRNRLRYAQEIAKAIVRGLPENDFLGVNAFDETSVEIVTLRQWHDRAMSVEIHIDRLKAEGMTQLAVALSNARRQMDGSAHQNKYVVLLSDGSTRGSLRELTELAHAMRNVSKVVILAIAIRAEIGTPDFEYMMAISKHGGGLFYYACDSSRSSQVILDYLLARRSSFPRSDEFAQCDGPIISGDHYR